MMDRRAFLATTASTITVASLAGCSEGGGDTENGNTGNGGAGGNTGNGGSQEPNVEILSTNFSWNSNMSWATISGEVRNNTDQELSYIEVQAYFYSQNDQQGTRLGSGMWNANNVRAGETLAYETTAAQMDQPPESYSIEVDDGF